LRPDYCTRCGAKREGRSFCTSCGLALVAVPFALPGSDLPGSDLLGQPPSPGRLSRLRMRRPRLKRGGISLVVGVLALLVIAGPLMFRPAEKTVSGSLSVGDQGSAFDDGCVGPDLPVDVVAGAEIELNDADDSFVRLAKLRPGTFDGASCVFGFTFHDVPAASSYTVRIAGRIVGPKRFTREQLIGSHWALNLSGGV
jgi:hypothetical protein